MEITSYESGVGRIIYTIVCSILDLAYEFNIIIRFIENFIHVHWEVFTWVIRYLNGFFKGDLKYTKSTQDEDTLEGYEDS